VYFKAGRLNKVINLLAVAALVVLVAAVAAAYHLACLYLVGLHLW
jgi:hypothetical protein